MKLFLVIAVLVVSASALPPVPAPARNYIAADSDDSDKDVNWQKVAEKKARSDYENAGRKLFQAYDNIEEKMQQIEFLAKNFIQASKTYVNNQHDVNTKTYMRALETLESHKKQADLLANKIKETSEKVAQFGAITTTIKPCSKPVTKLGAAAASTAALEVVSASTTAALEVVSASTAAVLETASVTPPTVAVTVASAVAMPVPVAVEATTINGDDIFADSLRNLNLNYNNVLQNIADKAIDADEVNTVIPPAVVML
ncbi:unnamed protein product [Diamesa hyperborea]